MKLETFFYIPVPNNEGEDIELEFGPFSVPCDTAEKHELGKRVLVGLYGENDVDVDLSQWIVTQRAYQARTEALKRRLEVLYETRVRGAIHLLRDVQV